jgi:hypothetical protein
MAPEKGTKELVAMEKLAYCLLPTLQEVNQKSHIHEHN